METKIILQINNCQKLYKIDTSLSLKEIIEQICEDNNLPNRNDFGLKLLKKNKGELLNIYVSEDNLCKLKDGYTILLTESLEVTIKKFKDFNKITDELPEIRQKYFEDLKLLSEDPEFIKLIVNLKHHEGILELMVSPNLDSNEMFVCLKIIHNIIKRKPSPEIMFNSNLIGKFINIVCGCDPSLELMGALAILSDIFNTKSKVYDENKKQILESLSVTTILKCIDVETTLIIDVHLIQFNALALVNVIGKSVKGEKLNQIIVEMNCKENKKLIFDKIITNYDKKFSKALNVYQTHALSKMQELLKPMETPSLALFSNSVENRCSLQMVDFEERWGKIFGANDLKFELTNANRMSLASMTSTKTDDDTVSTYPLENNIEFSQLTHNCLLFYQANYENNFRQSLTEENYFGVNIYLVAEQITRILREIFSIGERSKSSYDFYYPIFFNVSVNANFFEQLFCRCMWLFSKTKKEMKISMKEDYPMVFKIFKAQLTIVLKLRPLDYKKLMEIMKSNSYSQVAQHIQKDKEFEFLFLIKNDESIKNLRENIILQNKELIFKQRMNILENGEFFGKAGQKKNQIYVKLNSSRKTFIWGEWDLRLKQFIPDASHIFYVSSISFLITGNACPHVKNNLVKTPDLAITIRLEDQTEINLIANNKKTANYWIDGINLLLNKEVQSECYQKELDNLVEMDCYLQLIELQGVKIPSKAPTIPPSPFNIPKRPDNI